MKTAPVLVFILSFCALSALSLAEDAVKLSATMMPPSEFTTLANPDPKTTNSTTATPTTTPNTTTPHSTTTKAHSTTTKAHSTTTKAHHTTTKPTTTKPTTTKPTTHKTTTTTTTTAAPVTTAPPPKTAELVGKYNLTKDGKQVCVMAKIGLKIRLVSEKANGTFIVQPNKTKAVGECKDTTANLTLTFSQGFVTFLFNKNDTGKNVYVKALSFELNYPLIKSAANTPYKGSNDSHLFVARIGHAYSCREESIIMGKGLYLDVTKDNIQAFNFSKSNDFGSPDLCPADRPNYNVAIAVGVTLLVLIVIVVVAYLVGRRRRSDGYQSL